ncbi:MAG: alpha/beta fold hydrolase [Proteobacteria bacterium]|nr:alpha/beta fold hydrolase [Pseudomonadota bacterium]
MKRIAPILLALLAMAACAEPRFHEIPVEVGSKPFLLEGTLTLPQGKGPFPGVVLLGGSGPADRDETIGPDKPFRDIAHGLAERGIAVLRYDKRTHDYPALALQDKHFDIDDEYTDDALAALKQLRATPGVERDAVFLLGHSQGAAEAPRIAEREATLAGLILVAAPVHPLFDEMIRQLRYLIGIDPAQASPLRAQLASAEAARKQVAAFTPENPEAPGPFGTTAAYWLSLRDYDPVAAARKSSLPLLIVQGGRDYQVTPADDFARWQQAFAHDPRATLREYPGLSHLMMPAGDPPSPSDYAKPQHVDAQVIVDIAAWIHAHARPQRASS